MSNPEEKLRYTFEQFLAMEEKAEYKNEYYGGEIFAMSGGTRSHSLIATNLTRELGNALRDKDCRVFNSDLLVRVEEADAGFYPDAIVVCGQEHYTNERQLALTNPTTVFEVLSESTAAWDLSGKFRAYRMLESVQEYVLIEQRLAQVEVYRRGTDGIWLLESYSGLQAEVELKSLGIRIATAEIYLGIEF